MAKIDFSTLEPCDEFLVPLGQGIWLMDNHRWAYLVWEQQRRQQKYVLVHADQHWDAGYDFDDDPSAEEELLSADILKIEKYVTEDDLIRYDSFIAPAVRRGMFDVVHFFCTENDGNDIGLYEGFLNRVGAKQIIHPHVESLAATQFEKPIVFDLCLDLFNHSGDWMTGDLWEEAEIRSFLQAIKGIISKAEIVTVSMSFDYSGTHADTRYLAQLVLPILQAYRREA